MTYNYTVTSYAYNCQVCGNRTSGAAEVLRCYACDIALCKHCYQHGFCPTHFAQLPPDLQQQISLVHARIERRKKVGYVGFAMFLLFALGVIIGVGSSGRIDIALPVGFFFLFLAIISISFSIHPYEKLRKRIRKMLAPQTTTMQFTPATPGTSVPTSIPGPLDASKKYCSYCGNIINKDAVFCEKCGKQVGPS
ncbi:MAG TPA: hypothetical protein VKK79_20330 [Candidatus Lokiarchaeia archaeon]|nr:hypothetical protein [Candidatus Lokiarchaeia archaeon]